MAATGVLPVELARLGNLVEVFLVAVVAVAVVAVLLFIGKE
jgi:hypothetical protein